jgi:uncharacterized protein YifN (PemK superfamily)
MRLDSGEVGDILMWEFGQRLSNSCRPCNDTTKTQEFISAIRVAVVIPEEQKHGNAFTVRDMTGTSWVIRIQGGL